MAVIIPFQTASAFSEQVILDGTTYIIDIFWNSRQDAWHITFKDTSLNVLVAGIRLVQGVELLEQYPDRGLPPGELYIIDTNQDLEDIGRNDFTNDRNLLFMYIPENEIAEFDETI